MFLDRVVSQCFLFMTTSSLDLTLFFGWSEMQITITLCYALAAMADVSSLCICTVRGWGMGISYRSVILNTQHWVFNMLTQFFAVAMLGSNGIPMFQCTRQT